MIKIFSVFETWNDDRIDKSLFVSGRAKHNPKVIKNKIEYKTDNGKFIAKIRTSGDRFICKVYKVKEDGSKVRIKRKIKNSLTTAHNFVREILNDKLDGKSNKKKKSKKKKSKKKPERDPLEDLYVDSPNNSFNDDFEYDSEPEPKKTRIRRYH